MIEQQSRMTVQKKIRVGSSEVLGNNSTSQLNQKLVQPSLGGALSMQTHSNRHGVEIHSSIVAQKKTSSSSINHIKKQQRMKSELRTKQSRSFPDINKAARLVIKTDCSPYPYQHVHSEVNFQRSTTPQNFSSTKVKQVPLPAVQGTIHERILSPRNTRSFTSAGERYLGFEKSRPQQRSLSAGRVPRSEQEKRFVKEKMELDRTRSMKRMSEMMSHRVDRMYYMRGAVMKPMQRYCVDNEELMRLKEMSKSRSTSRRSRNGSSCCGNHSTTPPPHSQPNVGDQTTEYLNGEEVRPVKCNIMSSANRPRSAASNKSNGSARSGGHGGQPSQAGLTEGRSVLETFSETSRNVNKQRLLAEEDGREKEPVDFRDEESCEPWAEVENDHDGRVNSSKKIRIFLTQFEDPLIKKDLLDKEKTIKNDTHSCSSNNRVQGNMSSTRKNQVKNSKNVEEQNSQTDIESSGEGRIASDNSCSGYMNADGDHESGSEKEDLISLKDEGYDINTNDEEIKNMEDGIRKFDIVSSQMVNVGHLEGSEIGLDDDEVEETYDSGVFSKPRNEAEAREALARRENKRKEKAAKKEREEEERRQKAMPKKKKVPTATLR